MKNRSLLKILSGVLVVGLMVSCMGMEESDPSSLQVPEVKTFDVKDNGSLVFELTASVDKSLSGRIAECGFYYGKEKSMSGAEKIECRMLRGTFSADITLHEYGETFYACSYISNGVEGNEICSDPKSITVKELQDYVAFSAPVLISCDKSSAKVSVDYKAADGVEVTESGACFGKTESLSIDNGSVKAVDGVAELLDLETGESYYVCSYVKDGDDVAYSRSVPFAVYGMPVVVTVSAPQTDSESAALCGEVEDDCGKEVTERGFLWCEGAVEVLDVSRDTKVKCGTGVGEFEFALTDLKPNKTYSFCAYAMNAEGIAYGEVVRFTTGVALPVHGKPVVDDITTFTVVLEANVLSDGGESASEQGFYWGENTNVEHKVKCTGTTFSYKLTGLSRNTTYYVKSYSVNSVGTACSDVIEFATMPELPTVSTVEVSEIAEYSVVCHGTITDDGGTEITDRGFVYSLTSNPDTEIVTGTKVSAGQGVDQFSLTLSELSPNVKYYVRAYAENSVGISYGFEREFTTKTALPSVGATTLVTSTSSSLTVSASLIDDGGEAPSEVGFYYSTSEEVDPATATKVAGKVSGSSFTAELDGLTRVTKYYVRAYAVNSAGEALSPSLPFTTQAERPVVETAEVTDITDVSATCGGKVTDDGGAKITAKGIVWSTSANPTVSLSTKTNAGNGTGEFSSSMTGLLPGTKYYVRAYATNSAGTSYGFEREFTTKTALPSVGATTLVTSTSSSLIVSASLIDDGGEAPSEVGFYYSTSEEVDPATATKVAGNASGSSFTAELDGLTRATKYNVRAYAVNSAGETLSPLVSFNTQAELPVVETAEVTDITDVSAVSGGSVIDDGGSDIMAKGIVWGTMPNPTVSLNSKIYRGGGTASFTAKMTELDYSTKYYVRAYATNSVGTAYGNEVTFETKDIFLEKIPDVSIEETANCYIVSTNGIYRFPAVKGNSTQSVGEVLYAEVLWESFGTDKAPYNGELIKEVRYENGYVVFKTNYIYREGNAVIAAKDASGTILWSWHIWLTDQPGKCVYANNAGTMMDRNLGATSATPGEVGALGLLYQWGRKDPFLGSSSISSSVEAKSTITWPSAVSTSSSRGTVAYATEHPTTFISYNINNNINDWYYSGSLSTDNTRWQSTKTIYDPCPAGWRVPDGGSNGVWNKAGFDDQSYDSSKEGMLFGSGISSPATWYPAAGYRNSSFGGALYDVGYSGYYWSATPDGYNAYGLGFYNYGRVYPTGNCNRANGQSVRCLQE